jgi:hypothetical protein
VDTTWVQVLLLLNEVVILVVAVGIALMWKGAVSDGLVMR